MDQLLKYAYRESHRPLDSNTVRLVVSILLAAALPPLVRLGWRAAKTFRSGGWSRGKLKRPKILLGLAAANLLIVILACYGYASLRDPQGLAEYLLGYLGFIAMSAAPSIPAWLVALSLGRSLDRWRRLPAYRKRWSMMLPVGLLWTAAAAFDITTWPRNEMWGTVLVRLPVWYTIFAPGVAMFAMLLAVYPQTLPTEPENFDEGGNSLP